VSARPAAQRTGGGWLRCVVVGFCFLLLVGFAGFYLFALLAA